MNIGYGPGINSYTDRNEGSPQLVLSVGLQEEFYIKKEAAFFLKARLS
jgi:hypothetical protein